MIVIGVTGGIASGKSEFSDFLGEKGAFVIDADEIAHEVLEREEVLRELKHRFGSEVLRFKGGVNRRYLARLIFFHPEYRLKLNSLVHPLVREEIVKRIEEARGKGTSLLILDVPLLWEARLVSEVDMVVWVKAPKKKRVQRLEKEGLSFAEALNRLQAGTPERILSEIADYVVENDSDREEDLKKKASDFLLKLRKSELSKEQLGHA
jgi:dephospho-CoA kinase